MAKSGQKMTKPKNPNMRRTTSVKPGQKLALGNDKTAKLSTFIELALKSAHTLGEYESARTKAQAMAEDFVNQYWEAKTVAEKKAVLDTIADRTEGKPKQQTDITSSDGSLAPILVQFVDKAELSTPSEE